MDWKDKRIKNNWRSCLTLKEKHEIAELEGRIKDLAKKCSVLRKQRQIIQNRATTRFRHSQSDKNAQR